MTCQRTTRIANSLCKYVAAIDVNAMPKILYSVRLSAHLD